MDNDVQQIAVKAAADIVRENLASIFESLSDVVSIKRAQFLEDFSEYCGNMYYRCSNIRTLYQKTSPVKIEDLYIKSRFEAGFRRHRREEIDEDELIKNFVNGQRIIIKGNGGSRKTVFLKYLWLSRFKNAKGRIPVFLELRRLNDIQTLDLFSFCKAELRAKVIQDGSAFRRLCESGRFEFIFDGFDEVSRDRRKTVERQIIDFADTYRNCSFLVSGREDDRFTSWSDFEAYSVAPLNIEEVSELIGKIPFDRKVRSKFLKTLDPEFFATHHSFLSSPLLAIMMLMTFSENAIIPSKLTSFYDSAFQTLLTWHDATKESFERSRALSIDEFRKVFSTFCLMSYYDNELDFTETSFRDFVGKALEYHRLDRVIDEVTTDFCESVNLIQRDGLKYVFVHRSFQEYFAAECVMKIVSGKAEFFLDAFAKRLRDNVFQMCYELHPELVYDSYLDRHIDNLIDFRNSLRKRRDSPTGCAAEIIEVAMIRIAGRGDESALLDMRLSHADKNDEAIRFLQLCQMVLMRSKSENLLMIFFRVFMDKIEDTLRKSGANIPDGSTVEISVSFSGESTSISVKNLDDAKVSRHDINVVKRAIKESIERDLPETIGEAIGIIEDVCTYLMKIRKERIRKGESIAAILGLSD